MTPADRRTERRQRGGRARATSGHRGGGSCRAGARSAPPVGGILSPACRRGQGGATRRATRLAAWYIKRGGWHGEDFSGSPCHSASGLSSPAGQVAVACACALVDFSALRLPFPVRREARLSRPYSRRVGVAAFDAHGGCGNKVGLIASEELGARLVTQPADPRS